MGDQITITPAKLQTIEQIINDVDLSLYEKFSPKLNTVRDTQTKLISSSMQSKTNEILAILNFMGMI
jgi:archaellum component FlaC